MIYNSNSVLTPMDGARMRDYKRDSADMRYGFRFSSENSFREFEEREAQSRANEQICNASPARRGGEQQKGER